LVVYDITNRASFDNARGHWLKELKAQADPSSTLASCIVLVGNKVDLETPGTTSVSPAEHTEAAASLSVMGERTSAKTALNVQKAFDDLVIAIYDEDKGKLQRMATIRTLKLDDTKPATSAQQRAKQCCNA
jgi:GTPase SAR1 family protein